MNLDLYCRLIFFSCFAKHLLCAIETVFYAGGRMCDTNNKDQTNYRGCPEELPSVQGFAQCLLQCQKEHDCVGVSRGKGDRCFYHKQCTTDTSGTVGESCNAVEETAQSSSYFSKHCPNGGKWDPESDKCQCVDGWIGPDCLQLPSECKDLILSGYTKSPVRTYFVLENDRRSQDLVPTYCALVPDTMYTNIPILLSDGSVSFNKTWREYRDGFQVNANNFWAGLNTWSKLSQSGYDLVVNALFLKTLGRMWSLHYGFRMSNESGGYQFTYDIYDMNHFGTIATHWARFGDCYGPYLNASFSAYDKDLDLDEEHNCASLVGSGWWFKGCDKVCNLFGWGPGHRDGRDRAQWMFIQYMNHYYIIEADQEPRIHIYLEKTS